MSINFMAAIKQLALEKGLPEDVVLSTVESALAAAYRKDYGRPGQHIQATLDPENGQVKVWRVYNVVEKEEEIENPAVDVVLKEAKKIDKKAKVGEEIRTELEYKEDFGRIAAQTAKQVIIQRIREAERDILYTEFKSKEGQIVNGIVQQVEGRVVIVSLGKTTGVLLPSGQIENESYGIGRRLRVYVQEVEENTRGPRIIVSRSSAEFIRALFVLEVPEIASGAVEIKGIAREAGARTKISVWSEEDGIDPVGSAVGQHGSRVQAVLSEIGEEKIDIILFDHDTENYILNAMSPAKINKITLDKKEKRAKIEVPEDQLSLAIGRRGQNVRLASLLTGWEIDVTSKGAGKKSSAENTSAPKSEEDTKSAQENTDDVKEEPSTKKEEHTDKKEINKSKE